MKYLQLGLAVYVVIACAGFMAGIADSFFYPQRCGFKRPIDFEPGHAFACFLFKERFE